MSPLLFAIYVAEIALSGAFVNRSYVLYADDILLISQSVCELQSLLPKCESELAWLDMRINVAKSCCLRLLSRYNVTCANLVTRTGDKLQWASEIRYIDVYIVSSRRFRCNISYAKQSFYRAANAIIWKSRTCYLRRRSCAFNIQ